MRRLSDLSWARTVDRSARTVAARQNGPGSIEWHESRLDPAVFADATPEQRRAAATSARRAWYAGLAAKSAEVRARSTEARPRRRSS